MRQVEEESRREEEARRLREAQENERKIKEDELMKL
jgi:hypothetical protein